MTSSALPTCSELTGPDIAALESYTSGVLSWNPQFKTYRLSQQDGSMQQESLQTALRLYENQFKRDLLQEADER
jgi:hypothetical protein